MKSERVEIRISPSVKDRLNKIAVKSSVTSSKLITIAVEEFIDKNEESFTDRKALINQCFIKIYQNMKLIEEVEVKNRLLKEIGELECLI